MTAGRPRTVAVTGRCCPVGSSSGPVSGGGGPIICCAGQELVGVLQIDAETGTLDASGDDVSKLHVEQLLDLAEQVQHRLVGAGVDRLLDGVGRLLEGPMLIGFFDVEGVQPSGDLADTSVCQLFPPARAVGESVCPLVPATRGDVASIGPLLWRLAP